MCVCVCMYIYVNTAISALYNITTILHDTMLIIKFSCEATFVFLFFFLVSCSFGSDGGRRRNKLFPFALTLFKIS